MANKIEIIAETAKVVEKDFYFENLNTNLPTSFNDGFQHILDQLAHRISQMLDGDFDVLMQIFYRIDLNEIEVKKAIALSKSPSKKLAELVIEREMQKAKTRLEYRRKIY
ncbi:MAG: hypothetical protein ACPGLV_07280 [Bacteroidia bacterium]